MPNLTFYFTAMGLARSPMTDFFKDFNGFCKDRKNFVPTPRYAKKLRAMWHSAELRKKVLSANPRYSTQCETQVKN
jgi:hypothetical protein